MQINCTSKYKSKTIKIPEEYIKEHFHCSSVGEGCTHSKTGRKMLNLVFCIMLRRRFTFCQKISLRGKKKKTSKRKKILQKYLTKYLHPNSKSTTANQWEKFRKCCRKMSKIFIQFRKYIQITITMWKVTQLCKSSWKCTLKTQFKASKWLK